MSCLFSGPVLALIVVVSAPCEATNRMLVKAASKDNTVLVPNTRQGSMDLFFQPAREIQPQKARKNQAEKVRNTQQSRKIQSKNWKQSKKQTQLARTKRKPVLLDVRIPSENKASTKDLIGTLPTTLPTLSTYHPYLSTLYLSDLTTHTSTENKRDQQNHNKVNAEQEAQGAMEENVGITVGTKQTTEKNDLKTGSQSHLITGSKDDFMTGSQIDFTNVGHNDLKPVSQDDLITVSQDDIITVSQDDLITGSQDDLITGSRDDLIKGNEDDLISSSLDEFITTNSSSYNLTNQSFDLEIDNHNNNSSVLNQKAEILEESFVKDKTTGNKKDTGNIKDTENIKVTKNTSKLGENSVATPHTKCYTHTVKWLGRCVVLCDRKLVRPCVFYIGD